MSWDEIEYEINSDMEWYLCPNGKQFFNITFSKTDFTTHNLQKPAKAEYMLFINMGIF